MPASALAERVFSLLKHYTDNKFKQCLQDVMASSTQIKYNTAWRKMYDATVGKPSKWKEKRSRFHEVNLARMYD